MLKVDAIKKFKDYSGYKIGLFSSLQNNPKSRDLYWIWISKIVFIEKILSANCGDPDQMPHYVASDLGLRCLPRPF